MKFAIMGEFHRQNFTQLFPDIHVVDFNAVLKKLSSVCPELVVEILTNTQVKLSILNAYEHEYRAVGFTGALLTEEVLQRSKMPVVVLGNESHYKYGSSTLLQHYIKALKGSCKVYGNFDSILSLFQNSSVIGVDDAEILMIILNKYKEDLNMSLEDDIRKAMMDLGIDTDADEDTSQETKPVKLSKKVENPKTIKKPEPEPEDDYEPEQLQLEFPEDTEQTQEDESQEIYCKIKDGKLALLMPVGLPMEEQEIAGMKVNVLTVSLPDLDAVRLQSLEVFNPFKPHTIVRVPIILEKDNEPESKPVKKQKPAATSEYTGKQASDTDDLVELLALKKSLDGQIKDARASGDESLVNELRKQRRAVRNKINQLS